MENVEWREHRACKGVDPSIFFPEEEPDPPRSERGPGRPVLRPHNPVSESDPFWWCQRCPVRQPCLDHAIAIGASGIWGGMTTLERNSEMRRRKRTLRRDASVHARAM